MLFKKLVLAITTVLMHSVTCDAKIIFKDINPDTVVTNGYMQIQMHPMVSGGITINFDVTAPGRITVSTSGEYEVQIENLTKYPQRYYKDDDIDNTGSWKAMNKDTLSYGGHLGLWLLLTDDYLPVRFMLNNQWHYGWIRIEIDMIPTYFSVKSWAYNEEPGAPIKAGEKEAVHVFQYISDDNVKINVAKSTIQIQGLRSDEQYAATVHDITGRKVLSKSVSNTENEIDLNNQPAGMYIVTVSSQFASISEKVMLQ